MSTEYVIALLGLFAGLCAVVALIWAIAHRQLQTEDRAMYEAMADGEPDYTASSSRSPAQVPRRSRLLFGFAFTAVFAVVGWVIVQTVRVASRVPHATPIVRQRPASE